MTATTQRWPKLHTFAPAFDAQRAFCADPARIVVANAAVRTGKTFAAARKFLNRVRVKAKAEPRQLKTFWVIAPTFEEGIAQKIELASLIPEWCVDRRRQGKDDRWRNIKQGGGKVWLKGNALIEFKSADRPEGLVARKIDGVWWTEIARSKYAAWPNVRTRLANTRGFLIADTSPFGHSWFYNEILRPAYDGKLADVSVHRWTAIDSPFIPREEIEAARAMLPKAFFERDFMASDDVFAGQIYDVDDARHVAAACPFTPDRALVVADVNTTSSHPAEFVVALVSGYGAQARAWVQTAYQRVIGLSYDVYVDDLAAHYATLAQRYPTRLVIDPSFHNELKAKLRARGLPVYLAQNDVLDGIRTLGSMLMPLPFGGARLTFAEAAKPALNQLRAMRWVVSSEGVVKPQPDKSMDDGWADACRYLAMECAKGHGFVQAR